MTPFVHPGRGPFALGPTDGPKVVLFHGLTGAPSELWPLGCALAAVGYRVEAPLWPGHGLTPEQLRQKSAADLLAQARRIADDPSVQVLGGLSMGALLALIATSERPAQKGLVLLSPALRLHGRSSFLIAATRIPGVARLPLMLRKGPPETGALFVPSINAGTDFDAVVRRAAESAEQRPGGDGRYDRIPLRWGAELRKLQDLAARAAPKVTCPVLIMHGLADRTADPDGSVRLTQLVRGPVHARFFDQSPHVVTLGPDRGAVAVETVRWLEKVAPTRGVAATLVSAQSRP